MARLIHLSILLGGLLATTAAGEPAAAGPTTASPPEVGAGELDARRKLRTAIQILDNGEDERAVAALENLLERYPEAYVRFQAHLVLGRHLLLTKNEAEAALDHLDRAAAIEQTAAADAELTGDSLEILLEAMYLTGVAHYQMKQYQKCFPILRKITTRHPNSIWANQAYYYIGMAHFVQKNWGKAIRYLSLVGTYIDPHADSTRYVEAGQRLFIKVTDADLPVLQRLNQLRDKGRIMVMAASGDKEELPLIPLSQRENIYIATVPTEVAAARPLDQLLQIVGGDTLTVRYIDANSSTGEADLGRETRVEVVSSGTVSFTLATYEGKARQAYTGQNVNLLVVDVDHDTAAGQQEITVKVMARYLVERKREESADFIAEGAAAEGETGPQWEIRDEVEVALKELSNAELAEMMRLGQDAAVAADPVAVTPAAGDPAAGAAVPVVAPADLWHTGRFVGRVPLAAMSETVTPAVGDQVLVCKPNDQIYVRYVDSRHADGNFDRVVEDRVKVVGAWNETIRQTTDEGAGAVIQAKKNLVEGEAYLALATIFKEMGLMKGAKSNVVEGLQRSDSILKTPDIATELKQRSFRLRWELFLLIDDLPNAIATMQLFGKEYPESRFADQALLAIGQIYLKQKEYDQAIGVFTKILSLPDSDAKAEAQFRIAGAVEVAKGEEAAIPMYQKVADDYPNSEFTGDALVRLVEYHITTNDFVSANNLLNIVFEEHPDKKWLDRMLINWAILAYRMKDLQTAYAKAQQLLMEYPDSDLAPRARTMVSKLRKSIEQGEAAEE